MLYPNIEAERARLGETKMQLAKSLNVSERTLRNWQLGRSPIPSNKLLIMCERFNCSADYLLSNTPIDTRPA